MKAILKRLIPQGFKNRFWHLPKAVLASLWFDKPTRKVKLIGVTGTDGKSTVSSLIFHIARTAGFSTGLMSTVSARLNDEEWPMPLHVTTEDAWQFQKTVAGMVNKKGTPKMDYLVVEASSHGLDQHRIWGCSFEIGVLTNITRDHLDYHHTFKNYLKAKAKLFQSSRLAVLNADDQSFEKIKEKINSQKTKVISYAIRNQALIQAQRISFKEKGMSFYLKGYLENDKERLRIETPLFGEYNLYNLLAAISVAKLLKIKRQVLIQAIQSFEGIKGRMEEINNDKGVRVFIDFASTTNALKSALTALRAVKKDQNRLIVIFGSAGLRDVEKRVLMGEVACSLAEISILTAEDPRTENVNKIINQIAKGCRKSRGVMLFRKQAFKLRNEKSLAKPVFIKIPDRQEAINFAIRKLARRGDFVVTCGKGHEQSMCFGRKEFPWSEHEAVRIALSRRRG